MNAVHLPEESWVNPVVTKMSVKQYAPVLERNTTPQIQSLWISKEVNMLLFNKAIAISFPDRQLLVLSDLFSSSNSYGITFLKSFYNNSTR